MVCQCWQWLCHEMVGKSLSSGDTPGVKSFIYDLTGGALEQDNFTLLQERWNLWREVGEDFMYCPHKTHTGGQHLLM